MEKERKLKQERQQIQELEEASEKQRQDEILRAKTVQLDEEQRMRKER